MKKKYLPLLLALAALPVGAQNRLSPSLRQQAAMTRRAKGLQAAEKLYPAFVYAAGPQAKAALQALGIKTGAGTDTLFTARIPGSLLEAAANTEGVRYVEGGTRVRPTLDKARAASGTDNILSGTGLPQAYTGKGVVVGVVDAGFDYRQPAFRSPSDDSVLRIRRVWEQTYTQGTPPQDFGYGSELTEATDILTAEGDISSNSHGTHVSAIAAGRDCGNGYGGAAPEADIVLVSMDGDTPDNAAISDAVAYIYAYAKELGKPCVVNLSLGTQTGPHDGTSAFDRLCDAMQGEGCLLVGSAGNDGASPIHAETDGGKPLRTFVDFISQPSETNTGGQVDIWGSAGGSYKLQVALIKLSTGETVIASPEVDAAQAEGSSVTFELTKNSKGSVTVTSEVNPVNNKPHSLVTLDVTNVRYNHALALIVTPADAETHVDLWADNLQVQLTDNELDGYTAGDTKQTVGELGGTGKRIISVGAYTTRAAYTPQGGTETTLDETVGAVSSFSAAGPSADGRMKPDISAPGCYIVSALSSNDTSLSSYPIADAHTWENHTCVWGYMQGTSMSAPLVTGTLATWLEADPTLTPEKVRESLAATATDTEAAAADRTHLGYGKLDAWAGLKHVIATAGISAPASAAATAASVRRLPGGDIEVWLPQGTSATRVALYSATGQAVLAPRTAGTDTLVLPAASLAPGTYILRIGEKSVKIAR